MIHKIIKIQNCGRFIDYQPSEKDYGWNGIFGKINTIYAENGSGKTTFTQILKSLSQGDCELMEKRKTLQAKDSIVVRFLLDDKSQLSYESGVWKKNLPGIEIFDSFFAETNMYVLSLGDYNNPGDFYDIVPGSLGIINEIQTWIKKRRWNSNSLRLTRKFIRENNRGDQERLIKQLNMQLEKKKTIHERIACLERELKDTVDKVAIDYIKIVNLYLKKFNPNLEITNANQKGRQFVYFIKVNGLDARTDDSEIPLRHVLSEGDKSSVSLSFFLARIDMLKDIDKRIIVFDDPISSFDTRRRMTTISILSKYAEKTQQFFLLSHDLHFIKDFVDKNDNCTNLKIVWRDGSSVFMKHNVKEETMTGISKDIYTLQKYLNEGAMNDFERREVIRCLRPVLEGVFRLKYFSLVNDTEWLGDFLGKIRSSEKDSPIYRLIEFYDDLSDINDYCKQYHHSNPKYMEIPISDEELRQYVQRTLDVLMYI